MAPDITSRQKVNNYDHIDLQQVKEHQCLIPLAVLGGILLLIIMGILSLCAFYKRPTLMHQRDSNVSEQHQQSSSETQYATLKFITGRHERVLKS
ncbi:hypothetical protein HF521_017565 [Silurus meridionalis]|uniref:Uncharacterized protein n=2 Tax=Silurus meridionalis TaxID=175797 RepID=A0A8T0BN45_SILME|nr:hypothetical protein HF521_017565 [Silurus meridionalis]